MSTLSKNYVASRSASKCATCNLRELCLPVGLDERETRMLDDLIARKYRIQRGERLLQAGLDFKSLYAVRSGFFKSYVLDADGCQQVTGFYMTGELLGLDAISSEVHICDIVALEDSEVCEVPFERLEEISLSIPLLMHHFHKVMSREIVRDHSIMMLMGNRKAEERLAAFLLNLSERFAKRGYSPTNFILRMTREEIGSYLGLKLETVSRSLSKLQEEGVITVNNKHVRLNDINRLSHKICGISN